MAGMELVILSGLQASGKSTFAAERFAVTHAHVSKDRLRNNAKPERRQRQLVAEALAAGRSVVVDNTNPTAEDRAPLIALGHEHGARVVGYYFTSSVKGSLARNARREGRARVPDVAIFATRKRLAPPSYAEGFDALYAVRIMDEDGGGGESESEDAKRFEVSDWREEEWADG